MLLSKFIERLKEIQLSLKANDSLIDDPIVHIDVDAGACPPVSGIKIKADGDECIVVIKGD